MNKLKNQQFFSDILENEVIGQIVASKCKKTDRGMQKLHHMRQKIMSTIDRN